MSTLKTAPGPLAATLIAMLGLASAMGIGRFAFTPLLPLMQQNLGLSLRHGAWLASANYIGYFLGALASFAANPRPGPTARLSLVAIAVLTLAMGLTHAFDAWLVLRLLAGVASAYALIGISSWVLGVLERWQRPALAGWAFGGVGLGMIIAGFTGLAAGLWRESSDSAWVAMGLAAAVVFAVAWRPFGMSTGSRGKADSGAAADTDPTPGAGRSSRFSAEERMLSLCYGVFGLGYIIPATFLPAFARQLINDPAVFGWVWPVFGLAALISTVGSSALFRRTPPRRIWAWCHFILAIGVMAPAVSPGMGTILLSTVCVGGTFVVITMVGLREARRVAGTGASRLIAAMTASFALGQLIGPLIIPAGTLEEAVHLPSLGAGCLLLITVFVLMRRRPEPAIPAGSPSVPPRAG